MRRSIFSYKSLFCFLLLPFLKPDGIETYSFLNNLYNIWFGIAAICITFLAVCYKYKMSSFIKTCLIMVLGMSIVTWNITGDFPYRVLKNTIGTFFVILLIDLWIKKRVGVVLNSINICSLVLIVLTVLLGPDKFFTGWLVGRRTTITTEILPAFLIVFFISSKKYKEKKQITSIIAIIIGFSCCVYLAILENVSTTITGLFVFIVGFIIIKIRKYTPISTKLSVIGLNLINIFIILFQNLNVFAWFIEKILHKSMTLTGRLEIWSLAMEEFLKKPIFGNGVFQTSIAYGWENSGYFMHNTLVQFLVDGGLFAFFIFLILLIMSSKGNDSINYKMEKNNMYICICVIMVTMITEVMTQHLYIYIILALSYNMETISNYNFKMRNLVEIKN